MRPHYEMLPLFTQLSILEKRAQNPVLTTNFEALAEFHEAFREHYLLFLAATTTQKHLKVFEGCPTKTTEEFIARVGAVADHLETISDHYRKNPNESLVGKFAHTLFVMKERKEHEVKATQAKSAIDNEAAPGVSFMQPYRF